MTATKIPASLVVGGGTGGDDYVYNPVKDHGAVGDNSTNNTIAIQASLTEAQATGGKVFIPHGRYVVTAPSTNYATTLSMTTYDGFTWDTPYLVNIEGQGAGNTCFISGSTAKYALRVEGSTTSPAVPHLYASMKDLSFGGSARGNGVYIFDAAFYKIEDCSFQSLDTAVYLESVLSSEFTNVSFWGSYIGVYATKGTGFSGPNAILFNKCQFTGSTTAAFRNVERLSNVTFQACNFEGCGTQGDPSKGAVDINVTGTDGHVGASFHGCYFEGNAGGYDVSLTNTGTSYVTHTFKGCNFNRLSTNYTTNNIKSVGKNIIVLDGCTFKGYGSYVESAARPYIGYDSNTIIVTIGCKFDSATAIGALSDTANCQTMQGTVGYTAHTAEGGFIANNCTTSYAAIGGTVGYVAKNVTTYPFSAQNPSTVSYWDIGTLNGGWVNLGAPYTSQTPGIGFRTSASTAASSWDSQIYASGGTGLTGNGNLTLSAAYTIVKNIYPIVDNGYSCGTSGNRWSVVYAATGTINTSDERCKDNIDELSSSELIVAKQLKKCIKKFRYKDAMQNKGDKARIHVGVIAQEIKEVFEKEGLDPFAYGVLCYDEWEDSEAVVSEDGTVIQKSQVAGNRYGVRYDELFAFILAAM